MIRSLLTNKYVYLLSLGVILVGALGLLVFDKVLMPRYTQYNQGVTVPDLTRVSLEEAVATISSLGLRYEISDRRSNAAFPANYVLDQAPGANTIVKPNRKVYLTVNAAVRPTVVVPNVTNLSLRNAQVQLQNYGLEVGTISYESSRFKNVVLQQSLPAGGTVDKGAVINLIVSDGLLMFKKKIKYLAPRLGERYASALTNISYNNKVIKRFGKISLKRYINDFTNNKTKP